MMRKNTIVWLIVAISLIVVGCIILGGTMTMLNGDFFKLSTSKYETNTYEIGQSFQNITVTTDTADIVFLPSENTNASVVCYEYKKANHSVCAEDGTLSIAVVDTRKWYDHIGIYFRTPKITVYLPQSEYGILSIQSITGDVEIAKDFRFASMDISETTGDVTNYACASGRIQIKTTTGDIRVRNSSAETLDLSVSTGNITLTNVTAQQDVNIKTSTGDAQIADVRCRSLYAKGTTGDTSLKNVIAAEMISVVRTTGDIEFDRCDGGELLLTTGTGDIEGSLLTEKVFIAKSNTGHIDVPKTTTGGKCEVSTNTGEIDIDLV